MILRKYSEADLREAVQTSFSLREILKKLSVSPAGGNYITLKKAIKFFEIDDSHLTGQAHLRNKKHKFRLRPLDEILVFGKDENTYRLKLRLLSEGVKSRICENCLLTTWLDQDIPLELHHKDGNRKNNLISNLELLCPNCHSLTDNYRGKNIKV